MSVEFYRGSPGKFDSRTLSRKTLSRWTGRSKSNANNDNNQKPRAEALRAGPRIVITGIIVMTVMIVVAVIIVIQVIMVISILVTTVMIV